MRRLAMCALLTFSMALWIQTAGAQGLPQGSYQQTCNNVAVNGAVLNAVCQDSKGHWRSTSLPDFQRCTSDITNDNGNLACSGYSSGPSYGGYQNVNGPNGSYIQSCQNINASGDDLHARCQSSDGNWHDTNLDDYQKCHGDIINDNGKLRCVSGGYAGGYANGPYYRGGYQNVNGPNGSYTGSCQDIHASGDDLHARCQTRDGGLRDTKLDDYQKCQGDIVNDDGKLRCVAGGYAGVGNGPYYGGYPNVNGPHGSYIQSCQNIRTSGDDLKARCPTRDGGWHDTKLDDYQKCRGDIVNDNGSLKCRK